MAIRNIYLVAETDYAARPWGRTQIDGHTIIELHANRDEARAAAAKINMDLGHRPRTGARAPVRVFKMSELDLVLDEDNVIR